jgi:D-alanine-D-alanine ligase
LPISDELQARLRKVAANAYRALRVRDYGRIDLRLTPTGDIYVIEVNANCYLEQSSEFATAAVAAGIDYPTLIDCIVQLALERRQHTEPSTRRRKKRKAQASARAQT